MKQEIWKWKHGLTSSTLSATTPSFLSFVASCCSDGEFGYTWRTWTAPNIAGVELEYVDGSCKTQDDAILAASQEVQRQLAAQGVRCEIRRVKR